MGTKNITRTKAEQLKLELVRLLTLDQGNLRQRPPGQLNEALIYGLDGPQEQQLVRRQGKRPPKTILHKRSGLPIRPLCVHQGNVVRAVPIDWDWGVEFTALRRVDPTLT